MITFVERLFKLQEYYQSSIDDDVLDFLRQFYNLPVDTTIDQIRDRIHLAEAQRYDENRM